MSLANESATGWHRILYVSKHGGKSRRRAGLETPEDESLEFFRGFSEPFEVLAGKGGE